jgi:hypothetical protein
MRESDIWFSPWFLSCLDIFFLSFQVYGNGSIMGLGGRIPTTPAWMCWRPFVNRRPESQFDDGVLLTLVLFNRIATALFWIGWSSYYSVHPVLPMMAGIPFGLGYMLVFTAMLNYLTDAYKESSASAQSAASSTRAIMAVILPFAATPLYTKLGIHWASSLLGFLALALAFIPFVFIKYGRLIRQKSGLTV